MLLLSHKHGLSHPARFTTTISGIHQDSVSFGLFCQIPLEHFINWLGFIAENCLNRCPRHEDDFVDNSEIFCTFINRFENRVLLFWS
jgi:hypothetical protein